MTSSALKLKFQFDITFDIQFDMENKSGSFETDLTLLFMQTSKAVTDQRDTVRSYMFQTINDQ